MSNTWWNNTPTTFHPLAFPIPSRSEIGAQNSQIQHDPKNPKDHFRQTLLQIKHHKMIQCFSRQPSRAATLDPGYAKLKRRGLALFADLDKTNWDEIVKCGVLTGSRLSVAFSSKTMYSSSEVAANTNIFRCIIAQSYLVTITNRHIPPHPLILQCQFSMKGTTLPRCNVFMLCHSRGCCQNIGNEQEHHCENKSWTEKQIVQHNPHWQWSITFNWKTPAQIKIVSHNKHLPNIEITWRH